MSVSARLPVKHGLSVATFAGGCFWGVENIFRKYYTGKGVLDIVVGYCNGLTPHPTYRSVSSSKTGHAEAVQVLFDPELISYRQLVTFFLRIHDASQVGRQGPDVGSQYRSAIFTHDHEQSREAHEVLADVQKTFYPGAIMATVIEPVSLFYDAEDLHQDYLSNNPGGYECPTHFLRAKP